MNATAERAVVNDYKELIATNYVGLASFIVLLYDGILTFDDEVQYIWLSKKKLVAWLFLFNRYVTPLGFAINIHAYTSPAWTPFMLVAICFHVRAPSLVRFGLSSCEHFVRYEGAMTYLGVAVVSLLMAIRVAAIYHDNRGVLVLLGIIYLVTTGVNAWLLSTAGPVHHLAGIHGCSMLFGQTGPIGNWASASAWLPLIYDTVVVVLVVWRTSTLMRIEVEGQSRLVSTLIKDGILYYIVILGANLALAVMIVRAPDGIKNICAQFQLLITVTMMSRITLNLRKNMAYSTSRSTLSTGLQTGESMYFAMKDLPALPQAHIAPPHSSGQRMDAAQWRSS